MTRCRAVLQAAKRRTQQRKTPQQQEQHPVLGHFVADLKYKRVYVTSVDALMQAPVWEKARTLRPVHAGEIFHAKKLEADKLEIQMIEAGKLEAVGDLEKKVWRAATYCSCAHRIGTFSLCYVLARDVNLLDIQFAVHRNLLHPRSCCALLSSRCPGLLCTLSRALSAGSTSRQAFFNCGSALY